MAAGGGVALLLVLVGIPWTGFPSAGAAAAGLIGEDYVRPPPRKALSLPWGRVRRSAGPQQVHISLAGNKHMRITWVTFDESSPSIVEYGKHLGAYRSTSEGESTSYGFLLYKSGKIHHVVIGPLEDDTVYYYRCGGQDPVFHLKTPPSRFPVTFTVTGDLGQTGWTSSTLDHIGDCQYDVHLLPGDLSYADYQQHLWDTFGELVQPLASARPWMVTEGNHEKEMIPFLNTEFRSYNARWKMPFEESDSPSNLFYSFEVSGAHIIMLGSYTNYDEASDQYIWLKADLAKVDRQRTPWLMVLFHVPWYNSNWASPVGRPVKHVSFQVGAVAGAWRSSRMLQPHTCGRCLARRRRARRRKRSRRPEPGLVGNPLPLVVASQPSVNPQVCQSMEGGAKGGSASAKCESRGEEGFVANTAVRSEEAVVTGQKASGTESGASEIVGGNSDSGDGNDDNALLPFALLAEDLFQDTPVSRLRDASPEDAPKVHTSQILALPAPPSLPLDLRTSMDIVEEAYQGEVSGPLSSDRLSKGEVMDILSEVENFMGSRAIETAKLIGVADDGVDKGLKSSMLLIKRRWLAGIARKAKADLTGGREL